MEGIGDDKWADKDDDSLGGFVLRRDFQKVLSTVDLLDLSLQSVEDTHHGDTWTGHETQTINEAQ